LRVGIVFGLILVVEAAAQPIDMREAARLDRQGRCKESAAFYEKALADASASAALLNNAGNHYLLCAEPSKARAQFERLVKLQSSHTNANLQLAIMAVNAKRDDEARDYLSRVRSDDPQVLFAAGNLFARLGMFDRAEQAFQRLLVAMPSDFDVLYQLGRAAARAQHYDRAQSVLTTALKLRPGDVDVLLELGLAHAASKDYSRAVYLLAQAQQKAPDRADIVLALARAAEDAQFYGDSAIAYDQYVQLKPQDVAARRDRGRVLAHTGVRLEEGLKEMRAYIKTHPEDSVGHYNLAQFLWRDDAEGSLDELAMALRIDSRFTPAYVSRAWLLHRLGRSAEAAKDLEAALAITPDNPQALDQLGSVYLALDRPEDAEKALRRASALNANDPDVLMHLGRALMVLDRTEEAQKYLDQYQSARPKRQRDARREPGMIGLATLPETERRNREVERLRRLAKSRPDDPTLQRNLAELLLSGGQVEEAEKEFDRLLAMNVDAQTVEECGRVLARAGRYSLARRFFERALSERPTARLDLAMTVLRLDGPGPALEAIDLVPADSRTNEFLLVRARILEAAERREEAATLLTDGLREATVRRELAPEVAVQLLRFSREKEAVALIERSVAVSPDDSDLLLTRAIVLAVSGQSEEAEKQLKAIESRWPEWDRPYLVHGVLLEAEKRKTEAMQKLKIALSLGSEDPAARCGVARLSGAPGKECACLAGLREFALQTCTN